MRKLAMHVSRSDRIKRLFDGVEQPRKRSRLGASQSRCALRPTQLAGGESRRIGRQREVRPRCALRCHSVATHDGRTPQRSTTAGGVSWLASRGWMRQSRRSWEEGFMPLPLPHISWTGNGKPL